MGNGLFDDEFAESPETGYDSAASENDDDGSEDEGPETGDPSEEDDRKEGSGEKLLADKYKTPEELETAYVNLQKKLGERDTEKDEMKQRLQLLEKFILQQQGQPPQGAVEAEPEPGDILDEFYDDPASVIDKRVGKAVEEQISKIGPALQSVQQFMTEQFYLRKASELAAKYPDFQELVPVMSELGEKYPQLAKDPNGMELAYRIAKGLNVSKAEEEDQKRADKRAARMPGSTGGTRRTERQLSEDEAIANSIFGNLKEPGGIFD